MDVSSKMRLAARSGNFEEVKELIDDYKQSFFRNCSDEVDILKEAVWYGQPHIAEYLIESGFKLFNKEKNVYILHKAVAEGTRFVPIVKLLLSKGASVNSKNKYDQSPLHCVKTVATAKVLFSNLTDSRPDVNAINKAGLTPLHEAARNLNASMNKFLLEHGADVNATGTGENEGLTALHLATQGDKEKIVLLLLKNKASVNSNCKSLGTPLHVACNRKLAGLVKLLVEHGADVEITDADGKTPIFRAIESGHADIVQYLLDKGAVLKPHSGQLFNSLKHKCPKLVEILINHGSDVNEEVNGTTALLFTVSKFGFQFRSKALETVRVLLSNGADVNAKYKKNGKTALELALKVRFFDVLPILLDCKAVFNSPNGETLLHLCALAGGNPDKANRMILNRGADINARNDVGETALHFAAAKGHAAVESLLQFPDVDINARNDDGHTPLYKAAAELNEGTALHFLLSHGADINIPSKKGRTPLQLVESMRSNGSHCTNNYYYDRLMRVSMALRSHVAKLKSANLFVSKENLRACERTTHSRERDLRGDRLPEFYSHETLHDPSFVERCKNEVLLMKRKRFGDSCISFYDVLSQSNNKVAIYSKNPAVSRVMNSHVCITKFPVYGQLIQSRYRRSKARVQLLEKAHTFLGNTFKLPYLCINIITDFLSNEELKKCVEHGDD